MDNYSFLSNATPEYIENLYRDFQKNPAAVDADYRKFFEGFDFATLNYSSKGGDISADEVKVYALIAAYRNRGHLIADTNPIRKRKDRHAFLSLSSFGLTEKDLSKKFSIGSEIGLPNATLQDILNKLQADYCGKLAFEYGYIREPEEVAFFRAKAEQTDRNKVFDKAQKVLILKKISQAVMFEKFLGTKYIGEKRFSLEGGENTIPALDTIIRTSANMGSKEVIIGMAHRGRLNVLANIMQKTYEEIFNEFEGNTKNDDVDGDGDVKYHMGYSSLYHTPEGKDVYLKLAPNPSHLEAVNPVVAGFARAKADTIYTSHYDLIVPVIIHGDAAVAGQGIVYEVLQMAKLKGYYVGGTIHFVINNQIGFTTGFEDARSSDYCTSVAATIDAPVLHVNGDDAEAVAYAAQIAAEYREKFNKDIFIDMVCYRKWGHNESDDPKYTQPMLYGLIDKHKNTRDIYLEQLNSHDDFTEAELAKFEKDFWSQLQDKLNAIKEKPVPYLPQKNEEAWSKLRFSKANDFDKSPDTAISQKTLDTLIKGLFAIPADFHALKKITKQLSDAEKRTTQDGKIDWATAELMAYGSILLDGKSVRLSGEDVKRGTFSHRHAVLTDETNDNEYSRLSAFSKDGSKFYIYNSHLSEYAVLGFEYGYAMVSPNKLVLWEAQFGDFSNGAQIIIDQFLASAESKWNRSSGLVMLLPHGYEGQGPEHSSARLERYLQLCAENNMVVVNITDPANYFHCLRRQMAWDFRKPLIVMTPKSGLRHPDSISDVKALTKGGFQEVIDDSTATAKNIRKVLLVSGRLYFDLLNKKRNENITDIAIVRLEQLYPLPEKQLLAIKEKYKKAEMVWVQDEPQNMGTWTFLLLNLFDKITLKCVSRKASASPATGHKKQHGKENQELLIKAFA